MIQTFKKLSKDDGIVNVFDVMKPENIFRESVESIAAAIDYKLENAIPRR
jgi:hypothetical protein